VLPPLRTLTAILAALALAVFAASARADAPAPATYNSHGVAFSYPGTWIELPVAYEIKIGTPLWVDTIGPPPQITPTNPPPASGSQPPVTNPDVVTLSAAHINVVFTKKNIGRYKKYFAASMAQIAASAHGQVESGPTRVTLGGLPGYAFRMTALSSTGLTVENRMVYLFKRKLEYFVNCAHPQNDPMTAEIESGCDQIMRSFRLTK